jgi:hypothetical protein
MGARPSACRCVPADATGVDAVGGNARALATAPDIHVLLRGLGLHVVNDPASSAGDVRVHACGVFPTGAVSVRVRPRASPVTALHFGSQALCAEVAEVVAAFVEGRPPRDRRFWDAATSHTLLALSAPTAEVMTLAAKRIAAADVGVPGILGVVMAVLGWCGAGAARDVATHPDLCKQLLCVAAPTEGRRVPLLCAAVAAAALARVGCRAPEPEMMGDPHAEGVLTPEVLWRRAAGCVRARATVVPWLSAFEAMYAECLGECLGPCVAEPLCSGPTGP